MGRTCIFSFHPCFQQRDITPKNYSQYRFVKHTFMCLHLQSKITQYSFITYTLFYQLFDTGFDPGAA